MLLFVMAQGLLRNVGMDFEFGYMTLILAHVTFNLPYVILNVMPKLRQMDKYVYEAALDLGCTARKSIFQGSTAGNHARYSVRLSDGLYLFAG